MILESPIRKECALYEDSFPRLSRNSPHSDTGTVWFNIHDSRAGLALQNIVGKSFMYGHHKLTIRPADKRSGVPLCNRCWRFGHQSDARHCPFKGSACPICAGPHTEDFHRDLAPCCKGNPNAKPEPIPPTPEGQPCSHPARCVNCGKDHHADDKVCQFWRNRFDREWILKRYTNMKVSSLILSAFTFTNRFPSSPSSGNWCVRNGGGTYSAEQIRT